MDLSDELKSLLQSCATDGKSACQYVRTLSFMQGFVLGQCSVLIVLVFGIRYLLMEDVKRVKKRYIPSRLSTAPSYRANPAIATAPPVALITSKTYYDIIHHPPESTDWLNVLFAQIILQYRDDAQMNNRLMLAIDELVNGGIRPSFVGPIHVTELNLGDEFPLFSNARIRPSDDIGSMRAEIDFTYNDQVTLGVETQVILNWPRQAFAALPVSLLLSVVRFSGTLTIELINPPETTTKPDKPLERYIAISSYPDFVLDLQVQSLIGSRTKLEDIPKLTDLIQTKLRNIYIDKLVYPTFVKIKVPNLWEDRDRKLKEPQSQSQQGQEQEQQQEREQKQAQEQLQSQEQQKQQQQQHQKTEVIYDQKTQSKETMDEDSAVPNELLL